MQPCLFIYFFNSDSRKVALEMQGVGLGRVPSSGTRCSRVVFPNRQHLETLLRAQTAAPPTVRNPLHFPPNPLPPAPVPVARKPQDRPQDYSAKCLSIFKFLTLSDPPQSRIKMEQVWLHPLYSWRDKHKQDKMIGLSPCCVTEPGLNAVHQNPHLTQSHQKYISAQVSLVVMLSMSDRGTLRGMVGCLCSLGLGNKGSMLKFSKTLKKWQGQVKLLVSQSCLTICNPTDCIDFSRQEYWSG